MAGNGSWQTAESDYEAISGMVGLQGGPPGEPDEVPRVDSGVQSLILDKNYRAVDGTMPEVNLALDSCRKLYPQKSQFILQLLTSLATSQKNLNNLILNRDNYFDAEAFSLP